jgi:hypothetical protein
LAGRTAHARRKFGGALKAPPKASREGKFGLAHAAPRQSMPK